MDRFTMRQDRDKSERTSLWKPLVGHFDAPLKLFQYRTDSETTALQLDWRDQGRIATFADEQIVAPFPIIRDRQRRAIHIDNDSLRRRTLQANAAPIFITVRNTAATGNLVGNCCNRSAHPTLPSWMRLKILALSLYSASLTSS